MHLGSSGGSSRDHLRTVALYGLAPRNAVSHKINKGGQPKFKKQPQLNHVEEQKKRKNQKKQNKTLSESNNTERESDHLSERRAPLLDRNDAAGDGDGDGGVLGLLAP